MSLNDKLGSYLDGNLLIAMPQMKDSRFERSVIYMVAHTDDGAMGLVLNQLADSITFPDLLEQLEIDRSLSGQQISVHFGGPVETGRGFVLHSSEYQQEGTLPVDQVVSLTATVEIVKDIAEGRGPRDCLLALGYAGWGPGQLETEIQQNGWLHVSADSDLVFNKDISKTWELAIAKLGFDLSMLSEDAGHA
ncbi:MAG: YqgE/AlgH family protein [Rhodospirillaceae bacterium]|jgi:putative transcriptional regulator|nr:YqgE/AlgH family protein [Rhodospirillaceae bacterium]MBT5374173.1 YqgE/AlgH family protein [Rhodospirillaceae bacterium]MBT5659977.1 YqgE/AlgH family protein [Rhodospirillaceae bacterium]MBT5752312.1 YqgE/AlgH family protein [Rhodospirillaceae bacterium]